MNATTSPLMRQFLALKREIPEGMILLFRIGEYYETFGEDAVVSSSVTNAALKARCGTQMCGFPAHSIDTYLARFVRAGKSVALADLMENTRRGKATRRDITRIVTPGTTGEEKAK